MRRGCPGHATTTGHASSTSTRWLSLAVALAVGLSCAAPAGADRAPRQGAGAQAIDPAAGHGPFAGRIAIRGGRKLYLECRGSGRPTVMLEAGTGNLGSIWTEPPVGPGWAVLPAVARFTRVCAYDRPGTYRYPDTLSRSDPVAMPRTARDIVRDLHALLRWPAPRAPSCWPGTRLAAWSRASTRRTIPGRSPGWSRSTLRTRTTPPP